MKFLGFISFLIAASAVHAAMYDFEINDLKTLNYALTLEHLENAYYRDGCNTHFSSTDFANAGYNSTVYNYICTLIKGHESSHVQALTDTINAAGGNPVSECTYNFTGGYSSVAGFISLAQTLENTGVMAYDGAIRTLTNVVYQQVAATIATVEARHASYLNVLNGASPSASAFDSTMTPAEIVTLITTTNGLLVSCNGSAPSLPLPTDASFNYNTPTNSSAANDNDQRIVNYALTLEFLEYAFYLGGVGNSTNAGVFTVTDFTNAGFNASVFTFLGMVRAHEMAHVATLKTVANPNVVSCVFNFTSAYASVPAFLGLARVLENTGVSAYDGAVNGISNLDYRQLAATIATVEGRHASYLNLVNSQIPFPDVFDIPFNETTVLAATSSIIVSCPFDLSLLSFNAPALYSPASLSTTTAGATSGSASTTGGSTTGGSTTGGSTTGAASSVYACFALIAALIMMM